MVYFIQAEMLNCIKIGYVNNTGNLQARLKKIRCDCPDSLVVLGTILEGSKKLERLLHQKFNNYHETGEWFKYDVDVEVAIKTILAEQGKIINEDGDIDEEWLKNYKFVPESSLLDSGDNSAKRNINRFVKTVKSQYYRQ